ncbi:MAG: DUF58 domain-containing protein [Armatimonadetes bacterium]|nr:DUF58 domain-containing protein [Armatimonadota bacterium]
MNSEHTPLLDSEFLTSLEQLSMLARRKVRGGLEGERRSAVHGRGVEFSDHRQYQLGDDYRYVDWNIFLRLDRLFLKLFSEEEDLDVHLFLDASGSMRYGLPSKLDYGKRLAAAIGYISLVNLDRVGVVALHGDRVRVLAPRRGRHQASALFSFLEEQSADGLTTLAEAIRPHVFRTKRRGLAVLITDLFDPAGYENTLKILRYQRFETFLLQVLADDEVQPVDLSGDLRLLDAETNEPLEVSLDGAALEAYYAARDRFFADVETFCFRHQVEYLRTTTSLPVQDLVLRYMRRSGILQ